MPFRVGATRFTIDTTKQIPSDGSKVGFGVCGPAQTSFNAGPGDTTNGNMVVASGTSLAMQIAQGATGSQLVGASFQGIATTALRHYSFTCTVYIVEFAL